MKVLSVGKLNKSFGKHHVLKDISFSLETGEIVGFIGPNGSGKSTTMKCIANLIFPESGDIEIAGYNLRTSRNQALSHLSALIESPGLYFNLSGMENLRLFASLRKVTNSHLDEVIGFTGLGPALKRPARSYSMGMKQRLALGIALLPKPTFLILDEPFSGLDPQGVFELREAIKNLAAEGYGIIFSSHQLLEMDKIASRNIFIKEGRMVPQKQIQASVAALNYKIYIDREEGDAALLDKLKAELFLSNYQQEDNILAFTLTDVQYLAPVLRALLADGRSIQGVVPMTANIESLYSSIYQGA
jgi:ABC-2 type transport system ATP-binding protein